MAKRADVDQTNVDKISKKYKSAINQELNSLGKTIGELFKKSKTNLDDKYKVRLRKIKDDMKIIDKEIAEKAQQILEESKDGKCKTKMQL